jgi:thiamine-phosphate diphosphorylase / hydroxyethylthiazole kinase
MSNNGHEARDLARLGGALVVNMGTVTPEGIENYRRALTAYNAEGRPVLFDPVGAGATQQRREAVQTLLASGYFDVIKGNESEIQSVLGLTSDQQHGVDSGPSTSSVEDKARLVQTLAKRERCVVLMTGAVDVVSDGVRTCSVHNGVPVLGEITGSGCTLGTTVASFLAVSGHDKLLAVLAGVLLFEIAAERALDGGAAKGPGTFPPHFLDQLYTLSRQAPSENGWMRSAKVQSIEIF